MSIARVAESARVGRPAIYRRYRNKSELVAAHSLMGSFMFQYLTVGRPGKGWSERVADMLWPAFSA